MIRSQIINTINQYYSEKIQTFGPVPQGVDWNSAGSQHLRFQQLTKLLAGDTGKSLLDYGCGYGALLQYLREQNIEINYLGYDISSAMIHAAKTFNLQGDAQWTDRIENLKSADYVIASGLFNIMEQIPKDDWEFYILETLSIINSLALKGFAFNMLTTYSDPEKMKSNLYYANPTSFFDHCKINFSKSVTLLHDYALYEFTIIVRKNIL